MDQFTIQQDQELARRMAKAREANDLDLYLRIDEQRNNLLLGRPVDWVM